MDRDSLEVSGLTVRFGSLTALDDVSLTAAGQAVTGIIGPNGAGKTTLLNAIGCVLEPSARWMQLDGEMVYDGQWLRGELRRGAGPHGPSGPVFGGESSVATAPFPVDLTRDGGFAFTAPSGAGGPPPLQVDELPPLGDLVLVEAHVLRARHREQAEAERVGAVVDGLALWALGVPAPVVWAIRRASSRTSSRGSYSGGQATATSSPDRAPASSSEWATFEPPSPTKASRRPSRPPRSSRIVSRSASADRKRPGTTTASYEVLPVHSPSTRAACAIPSSTVTSPARMSVLPPAR